jgi:isopropylmalate/homocitrate/citramalate synthase
VGGHRRLTFGKHTGSALVRWALEKHKATLEREGVEITDELIDQVVKRVKQIREKRAEEGITEGIIQTYYKMLRSLELTEEDVITIATGLAKTKVES